MPFEIFDSSADDNFDSPLTRGDAELFAEEADWPEELSLLAGQLSADAARLAAIYPVDRTNVGRGESNLPTVAAAEVTASDVAAADASPAVFASAAIGWISSTRGARWIAAAAVLALASLATFSAYPPLDPVVAPNAAPAVLIAANAVQIAANGEAGAGTQDAALLEATGLFEASGLFEESGFENLSSPAQEALLDLFEDDQLAQASLSI